MSLAYVEYRSKTDLALEMLEQARDTRLSQCLWVAGDDAFGMSPPFQGGLAALVSRAARRCTTAVSKFRINVRLSVQHKCYSVMQAWYQMMASWGPPGIAASEDLRRPGTS